MRVCITERKPFSCYIRTQEWPCELHTIKDNMLRTTVMDDDLNETRAVKIMFSPRTLRGYDRRLIFFSKQLRHSQSTQKNYQNFNHDGGSRFPQRWMMKPVAMIYKIKGIWDTEKAGKEQFNYVKHKMSRSDTSVEG